MIGCHSRLLAVRTCAQLARASNTANASLLQALSVLDAASAAKRELGAGMKILQSNTHAPPQQRAPRFDAPSAVDAATMSLAAVNENARLRRFRPGDTYIPSDLVQAARDDANDASSQSDSAFVELRKYVDIFRRKDYDLWRAHLNVRLLGSCMSPTGGIMHRADTGLSAMTQRRISRAIRRARHMGLVPYLSKPVVDWTLA